jgi:hypothetical protein
LISETLDRIAKATNGNSDQIELLLSQNQRVEAFLDEVVELLRKNQKVSAEINEKMIEAESNYGIYKKEVADVFKDMEGRHGYFQTVAQSDTGNLIKMQKETNKNLESFISQVNHRTNLLEETLKDRLDTVQDVVTQISKRELNDELLKGITAQQAILERRQQSNEEQQKQLNNQLANIWNEVRMLVKDADTDTDNRFKEITSAIGTLARGVGQRNPLLES